MKNGIVRDLMNLHKVFVSRDADLAPFVGARVVHKAAGYSVLITGARGDTVYLGDLSRVSLRSFIDDYELADGRGFHYEKEGE